MVRSTMSVQYFSPTKKEMQKFLGIKQFPPQITFFFSSQENFKKEGHQRVAISTKYEHISVLMLKTVWSWYMKRQSD